MSNYSKLIAAIVGALVSWLVVAFSLPAEWAAPNSEIIVGITGIITAVLVYFFPANKPSDNA